MNNWKKKTTAPQKWNSKKVSKKKINEFDVSKSNYVLFVFDFLTSEHSTIYSKETRSQSSFRLIYEC